MPRASLSPPTCRTVRHARPRPAHACEPGSWAADAAGSGRPAISNAPAAIRRAPRRMPGPASTRPPVPKRGPFSFRPAAPESARHVPCKAPSGIRELVDVEVAGQHPGAAARGSIIPRRTPAVVSRQRPGREDHTQACVPHPPAEIRLFPEGEIPGIQPAHRLDAAAVQQEKGALHPFHIDGNRRTRAHRIDGLRVHPLHVIVGAFALPFVERGARHTDARVARCGFDKLPQAALLQQHVVVAADRPLAAGLESVGQRQVVRHAVSQVPRHAEYCDIGVPFQRLGHAAVGTGVVHEEHAGRRVPVGPDRIVERPEPALAVEVQYQHRDFRQVHGQSWPPRAAGRAAERFPDGERLVRIFIVRRGLLLSNNSPPSRSGSALFGMNLRPSDAGRPSPDAGPRQSP